MDSRLKRMEFKVYKHKIFKIYKFVCVLEERVIVF